MYSSLMKILAAFGALTILLVACSLLVALSYSIREFVEEKKYKYRRKHRFDKPPTAKCYCVDCKHWRKEDGRCFFFKNRNTADCWFCWNAEPLSRNEYIRREQNNEEDDQ